MNIRLFKASDREPTKKILEETDMFADHEIKVAMELIDTFLGDKAQEEFIIHAAEDDGETIGYVCFGPTPVTEGTYDLYWIAVKPGLQGKGVGRKLLEFAEESARRRKGRMMIIETSSQEKYAPTQGFYLKNGYRLQAEIPDYYKPGDNRQIYIKYINEKGV